MSLENKSSHNPVYKNMFICGNMTQNGGNKKKSLAIIKQFVTTFTDAKQPIKLCDDTGNIYFNIYKDDNKKYNSKIQRYYHAKGSNGAVYKIRDNNKEEYILKITHDAFDEDKYSQDKQLLPDMINHLINVIYYGDIIFNYNSKEQGQYKYIITPVYKTFNNESILSLNNNNRSDLKLVKDLASLLYKLWNDGYILPDLKLSNIGYSSDNTCLILLDYDRHTIHDTNDDESKANIIYTYMPSVCINADDNSKFTYKNFNCISFFKIFYDILISQEYPELRHEKKNIMNFFLNLENDDEEYDDEEYDEEQDEEYDEEDEKNNIQIDCIRYIKECPDEYQKKLISNICYYYNNFYSGIYKWENILNIANICYKSNINRNENNIYSEIIENLNTILKPDIEQGGGYRQYKYNKILYLKIVNTAYTSIN